MSTNFSVIESLGFSPGAVNVNEKADLHDISALKRHYVKQVEKFGIDKIYFSGEFPSVYFKSVPHFGQEVLREILAIQKTVWNQGKVPFLFVQSPVEVRVYNCYAKPVYVNQEDRSVSDLELYKTAIQDLEELDRVFGQVAIETGTFWREAAYAKQLDNNTRVEKQLIDNLKKTRAALKRQGLPIPLIHDLLLRSLFILYLEDRKATDAAFYQRICKLPDVGTYFDALDSPEGTYRLFEELEDRFNGNLSPVTNEEREIVNEQHLKKIKECFWSEIREDGQLRLFDWRLFNFEVIPIQVLSEIYEDFLGAEDPTDKKSKGAFYTPHPLAEFVLNEMLPYPDGENQAYNLKVLDPTCGSGIFLVEALNRLLDRWEEAHPTQALDFETICAIVLDNIFGIEIKREAIKVAAFSLYLAMLDRLNPKTLWQNKRFPYLIYDPEEKHPEKQGRNLFRMSSLGAGPFEGIGYDLVVGNPPFGRGKLDKFDQVYLDQLGFAREMVLAFLHRVTVLAPNAMYGLICGSKPVLFNNGEPYKKFREFLFNETYVEKVFNFSALRRGSQKDGGRNLFASAVSPISVVFYTKRPPIAPSNKILYCAPRAAIKNRIIDGIAIDKTDIKYLPRTECQNPDTKIWKVAMWGTERDFLLIERLRKGEKILETIELKSWETGAGFQLSEPRKYKDTKIKSIPSIESKYLSRYYTSISQTYTIDFDLFRRVGNPKTYKSPHLLIKRGQSKKRFCASFLDFDCSFKDVIYGIYANGSETELKLLTTYLNSGLFSYLLFLLSASWGVDREEIKKSELFSLPNVSLLLSSENSKRMVGLLDQIIQIKKSNRLDENQLIEEIEQQIETTLWDALKLSETERILIEDLLQYSLDAFQNKQKSIAFKPSLPSERRQYAAYLSQTINQFLGYGDDLRVWTTIFDIGPKIPLNLVVLHFNRQKPADHVEVQEAKEMGKLLKTLEQHTYQAHAESIYYRRYLRYYTEDRLYLIKPNEKRFWSRSMALNDADEIVAEILTTVNG